MLSNPKNRSALTLALSAGLVLLVSLIYWPTLRHGFVNYDDDQYVYENPAVQGGVTLDSVQWAFTRRHSNNWHPLTWVSHMADCQWFGLNPAGHHATSVALHALNAVLLLLLVRRCTNQLWVAAFVAAVFALHPLRVESVAWVAERKDVLSGLFFLLTLLAYLSWVDSGRTKLRYGLVLLLFACGLMSKPMLVTVPMIFLLLDFWPLGRVTLPLSMATTWRLIWEKIPFIALSAASCVATVVAQREAVASIEALPFPLRFGNAVLSILVYLKQLFFPVGLVPFYPFQASSYIAVAGPLCGLAVIAISFGAYRFRQARPFLLFGWLWYLVMLLPVIGILQVGEQAHADRYTYLPQIGVLLALAMLLKEWITHISVPPRLFLISSLGVVSLLTYTTSQQLSHWRNSRSLWEYTLSQTERNDLAHINLGHVLIDEGKPVEALEQFRLALQIRPHLAEAHNNIATVLMDQGNNAAAMLEFEKAIKAKPHYAEANNNYATLLAAQGRFADAMKYFEAARQARPDYPEVHYNMANLAAAQGKLTDAIALYQQALRLRPRYAKAYLGWGAALVLQRKPAEAIEKFQAALQITPDFAEAHYNLGLLLVSLHRENEAVTHFERAGAIQPQFADAHYRLALTLHAQGQPAAARVQYEKAIVANPTHSSSHNNLAWMLATSSDAKLRDGPLALEHALKANELTGGHRPQVLDTLAAAQAEAGNFAEAAATIQKALELPGVRADQALAGSLQSHLQLYRSGTPLREVP